MAVGRMAEIQSRVAEIQQMLATVSQRGVAGPSGTAGGGAGGATAAAGGADSGAGAGFAQALSDAGSSSTWGTPPGGAVATASASVGGPVPAGGTRFAAVRGSAGSYPKLVPPAELVGYGNGRIPATALSPIGIGSHRLWAPAAQAFTQMRSAAAADGVRIGVTDSYRDYGTQVSLAKRKGLYSQGGWAATPGTSNHGWGMAVDIDVDAKGQAWMRENGWKYGFVEDTPREPWHWGFRPAAGTQAIGSTAVGTAGGPGAGQTAGRPAGSW